MHLPQVVTFAEYEVRLCVAGRADLAKSAVAAAAFETVLVPKHVQRPQQVPCKRIIYGVESISGISIYFSEVVWTYWQLFL